MGWARVLAGAATTYVFTQYPPTDPTFRHLAWWVGLPLVWLIVAFVEPKSKNWLIDRFVHRPLGHRIALSFMIVLLLAGYSIVVVTRRPIEPPPFTATAQLAMTSMTCDRPALFWVLTGESRLPINAMVFVRVANNEREAVTINALLIEAERTDGSWVSLSHIPTYLAEIYAVESDPRRAVRLIDPTPWLDQLLANGLPARGDARGWIFLRYPNGFEHRGALTLRVTLEDAAGRRYQLLPFTVEAPLLPEIRERGFWLDTPNPRDISGFKIAPCWTPGRAPTS